MPNYFDVEQDWVRVETPLPQQEMVNWVHDYFIVRGHSAGVVDTGTCLYNGPCALGIFIQPDLRETYDIEGVDCNGIYSAQHQLFGSKITATFLLDVQHAHDKSAAEGPTVFTLEQFHTRLSQRLADLCSQYGLEMPK